MELASSRSLSLAPVCLLVLLSLSPSFLGSTRSADRVASLSLSSLSRGFLPLFLSSGGCDVAAMQPALQRRASGGRVEAQRARSRLSYTALTEHEAVRVHLLHVRTKMAAASLSERRGGSFFSVRF